MATAAAVSSKCDDSTTPLRTRTQSSPTIVTASESGKAAGVSEGNNYSSMINSNPFDEASGLNPDTFSTLSSVEMMEVLTRGLMKWQGEFGKVGEK